MDFPLVLPYWDGSLILSISLITSSAINFSAILLQFNKPRMFLKSSRFKVGCYFGRGVAISSFQIPESSPVLMAKFIMLVNGSARYAPKYLTICSGLPSIVRGSNIHNFSYTSSNKWFFLCFCQDRENQGSDEPLLQSGYPLCHNKRGSLA